LDTNCYNFGSQLHSHTAFLCFGLTSQLDKATHTEMVTVYVIGLTAALLSSAETAAPICHAPGTRSSDKYEGAVLWCGWVALSVHNGKAVATQMSDRCALSKYIRPAKYL